MADVPVDTGGGSAPAPTVPTPASAPRPMSESDAVASVAGLLEAEDEPPRRRRAEPRPQQTPSQDTEEAASDEPDDETDHRSEPTKSWSNEDKAVFSQRPPEAQAVITRRESERDRAFQAKTQEIAQHRHALEATFGEIQQERSSYATNLEQLLAVAMPEAQQFANVDWQRLAQESPADYVRLTAERDALRGRIGAIQGELQRVQAVAQQDHARQFASLRASEAQRLAEKLPEFADSEKGPKLISEIREWLQG